MSRSERNNATNFLGFSPLVGVIDTGFSINNLNIDYSRVHLGSDFIDGNDHPLLAKDIGNHHGSYILQIIDAPNVPFLWLGRAVGSGQWAKSLVEFVEMAKASKHQNAVVNLSFDLAQLNPDGSVTTRYELTDPERSAIEYARHNGILIVAASGNENADVSALGQASQHYDNIITVGATDGNDRAPYSSYGNGLTLVADGSIFGVPLGTSAATAQVTKAISQIWAVNPELSYQQIIDILKTTATELNTPGWNTETGFGLLNISNAINLAIATAPNLSQNSSEYRIPVWTSSIQAETTIVLERPAGFFDDVGDFLEDVADGIVDGITTIGGVLIDAATFPFKTIGEAIAFVTDKAGDGLKAGFDLVGLDVVGDALNFIADRVGEKTQALLERGAQYIDKLPDRIKRTANDLFSENLWNNFGKWTAENLTNIIELSGIPEIAETFADLIKFNTRALNDREKELARSVFGDSLNLNLVRIDEYSVSATNVINGGRPFTTFNTINTWDSLDDATLIHELSHVWQYGKVGAIYIPDALSSQDDAGVPGTASDYPPGIGIAGSTGYRYGGFTELEKRINNGQKLSSFNYEQQASIVEDYYKIREDNQAESDPKTANNKYLPLYAYFVQEVSTLPLTSLIPSSLGLSLTIGTNNADRLDGDNRDNTIIGLAGDDFIDGGLGDDLMSGGVGNDTFVVDSPNDSVKELPDQGIDTVNSFISYTLGDNLENLTLIGNSAEIGTGNNLDNILTGNDASNTLNGLDGNDTLKGLAGADLLIGGVGKDTLIGGTGFDTVSYASSSTGVAIDLSTGLASGGDAEGDILIEIEGFSGSEFSDTSVGDNNANTLSGLGGDDILQGRGGDDRFNGGAGNDSIDGGIDIDTIIYETAPNGVVVNLDESQVYSNTADPSDLEPSFTIASGTALDGFGSTDTLRNLENIIGSAGDDVLIGNAQKNTLNGLAGNDLLIGNGGDDILDGGSGTDTISYRRSPSASGVSVDLATGIATNGIDGVDTLIDIENIVGSQFADRLTGNSQANTILGGDGNDIITGQAGDDRLFGENGNDEIYGGTGNDYLIGGAGADLLDGGTGNDTVSYITATAGVTIDLANKINTFADASGDRLISIENLEGSNYNDFLYGDENDNILSGAGSNDIIRGAGGDDRLDGGTGDNILNGGDGNDTIVAADGKNTVYAELGNDSVLLGNGNNTVFAGNGNNSVVVGNGNNTIYAESGNDAIFVGNGNNTVFAGDGTNTIAAGAGNDTIYGGALADVINAGAGNNTIFAYDGQNNVITQDGDDIVYAGAGRDFIATGGGNDTIFAGDGDNWIAAGLGNNIIYSGSGKNLFILEAGAGVNTIKNFAIGKDRLGLAAGLQPEQLTIAQVNSGGFFGTQISIAGSSDVLAQLEWTPADRLTASSFTPNLPLTNSSLISLFG